MILYIFEIANKERGALVGKLGPSNFNYWKRTGKADSDISFFYCLVGGWGCWLLAATSIGRGRK